MHFINLYLLLIYSYICELIYRVSSVQRKANAIETIIIY